MLGWSAVCTLERGENGAKNRSPCFVPDLIGAKTEGRLQNAGALRTDVGPFSAIFLSIAFWASIAPFFPSPKIEMGTCEVRNEESTAGCRA